MSNSSNNSQASQKEEVTPMDVISGQFGIKPAIGAVINSFLNDVVTPTIEDSDTALITGAAGTAVQMNLHCESVIAKFDVDKLEQLAATYVIERTLSQACRDLHQGIKFGDSGIERAKRQFTQALSGLQHNKGDIEKETSFVGRVNWLTQMKCQQVIRTRLFDVFQAMYRAQTGKVWVFVEKGGEEALPEPTSVDAGSAALMA